MTKSTITIERLEKIKSWRETYGAGSNVMLPAEEAEALALIALAAIDSESGCLPLDYLQGHKDGLEWAAQLAEANHPETGDWLYDDPIELAKAIRKGPDMPPSQPALDTEPDRNPVLGYADSYRDMAKQGVESVPIWSVITDLERNIAPLYRHAQPAPVVPAELPVHAIAPYSGAEYEAGYRDGWNACRAAMLRAGNHTEQHLEMVDHSGDINEMADVITLASEGDIQDGKSPAQSDCCPAQNQGWIPVSEQMPEVGDIVLTAMGGAVNVGEMECSAANCRFFTSVISGRELPATHLPLPAAPQEVKSE
ncbi:Uncharacterised protein [Klebsiella pneumoniae]|uniref:DUF551 domain-containing protein n=1 Tax=Klebsiella pneumoniae TaxID=573 RepID=UPI000E2E40F4|nr:DUF551 domain-containing protein [Klebsiella pneumoniae]VVK73953.1 Uncharacterised protein [Klebsiella pneumoniae]